MSEFPEHDKLIGVVSQTQTAADFVLWLGSQGIYLAEYVQDNSPHMTRTGKNLSDLLAEWKGVDLSKLEAEKRTILARVRQLRGS